MRAGFKYDFADLVVLFTLLLLSCHLKVDRQSFGSDSLTLTLTLTRTLTWTLTHDIWLTFLQ